MHRLDYRQHVVYEIYDRSGQALYVGCTSNLVRRLAAHQMKHWWQDVHEIHTVAYRTKRLGQFREQDLIRELEPLHNQTGTQRYSEAVRERNRVRRETTGA